MLETRRARGTVDSGFFDLSEDALFEAVSQGGELGGAFGVEPFGGELGGLAEAYDAGYVFGSGAALALVGAAVHHRS